MPIKHRKHRPLRNRAESIIVNSMRICPECNDPKPLNMFHSRHSDMKLAALCSTTYEYCKICAGLRSKRWRTNNPAAAANADLKKKYGITLEQKHGMLATQGKCCAACGVDRPGGKYNAWHLDHNHETGEPRGVLCADCNLTLGNAHESIPRLAGLIAYLKRPSICAPSSVPWPDDHAAPVSVPR